MLKTARSHSGVARYEDLVPDPRGKSTGWAARLQQEVLTATCWLDPSGAPSSTNVEIVFSGRRVGATGKPHTGDRFSKKETVETIPGTSPISVTTRVTGVNQGEWVVTARPAGRAKIHLLGPQPHQAAGAHERDRMLLWPWRYRTLCAWTTDRVRTSLPPFAPNPGIVPLVWSILAGVGIIVGLAVQAALLARAQLPVGAASVVSLFALGAGMFGAKLWYVVGNRGQRFDGWCIQGFLFGAGLATAIIAPAMLTMSTGTYLDALAPGLLLGMAIGRVGCFFAGCCCGRATVSRWGVWSSDQRIGRHRFPVQLFEATLCLAIGVVTFIMVLLPVSVGPGTVFIGAVAAYTLGRQFLLPLRAKPRYFRWARSLVLVSSAIVLAFDISWLAHT